MKPRSALPLAPEFPVLLRVNGSRLATFMCTPDDLPDLARGWLLTRGLVTSGSGITCLEVCETANRIDVVLENPYPVDRFSLNEAIASGCGSGVVLTDALFSRPKPGPGMTVSLETLREDARLMFDSAVKYAATGGMHCALLAVRDGRVWIREDVGRHNAVDKVIGAASAEGVDFAESRICTSGRIAADMALKAVSAGVPVLVSRSIPTVTAFALAEASGLTLVGRIGSEKEAIYCGCERIVSVS